MTFFNEADKDPLLGKAVLDSVREWNKGIEAEDSSFRQTILQYSRLIRFRYIFIVICMVIIFIIAGISMTHGAYNISYNESYELIWRC